MIRAPALAALFLALAQPAAAWWNIWQPIPVPDPPPPPPPVVQDLREAGCGAPGDALARFGETTFMRGETDKSRFPEGFAEALAAAMLSEAAEVSETLLAPYLSDPDPAIRAEAKTGLARALARRGGPLGPNQARIAALLADPDTADHTDAHYLRAATALEDRDWDAATAHAGTAITAAPQYYNAWVIASLSGLESLGRTYAETRNCPSLLVNMQTVLEPLLTLGACPTHVAHFDIAASRYLSPTRAGDGDATVMLRRLILAYVARNDRQCEAIRDAFISANPNSACVPYVTAFTCADAPEDKP